MWLRRIARGLRERGALWLVDRALSVLQERLFDLRYGTDTVSYVELKSLTIESENAPQGTAYQPTRLRLARRVISALSPPPGSAFVDFGCGKGRVLLLAAEYGFQRVTGVEFARELCAVARDNVARYRRKTGVKTDIHIVEGDAAEYEIQEDENFFFMSNPFSAAIVEQIAKNVLRSLAGKDRKTFLIYNNPVCREAITRHGFSPLLDFNRGECIVYGNPLSSSEPRCSAS